MEAVVQHYVEPTEKDGRRAAQMVLADEVIEGIESIHASCPNVAP